MSGVRLRALDERGVVGGVEVLPFGILVFVVGTLLLVNAWGVIDGKLAATAAAREAARAYVESSGPGHAEALGSARAAAIATFAGHRVNVDAMEVLAVEGTDFFRCATATFEVRYRVPTIRLPWVGGLGGSAFDVSARHHEVVDPYRDGVPFGAPDALQPC
ncbi:MAG TPA: hypothetical protein VMN58_09755 [Acidimicrobiales bacterium]|nr:hypothetical protein [Acidimicrobiales bacterium]